MVTLWEAYDVKYARVAARTLGNHFINDDDHAWPMPIEFFVCVMKDPDRGRTILVDTIIDAAVDTRRRRPHNRYRGRLKRAFGRDCGQ